MNVKGLGALLALMHFRQTLSNYRVRAHFGTSVFDEEPDRTLSEQISDYLDSLGAGESHDAPYYESLPTNDLEADKAEFTLRNFTEPIILTTKK